MALSNDDIRACANRLHQAEKTRTQIRQLSQDFPDISIADAYAIQKAWVDIKIAEGRIVRGHKIGLTSQAMQSALDINQPDSGVLLDDMFFADGGLVPTERFIGTRVEAKLAFVMSKRLAGPDCTLFDVLNATDFVCRRWRFWTRASSASIPGPRRRGRFSTPSPLTRPMPASCSADGRSARWT